MKRTAVASLVTPLWVPAAGVVHTAYQAPFLKPRHLVYVTIVWVILAYSGALILGLPPFYPLGLVGVRNRTSFWSAITLGLEMGVLTFGVGITYSGSVHPAFVPYQPR